MGQSAVQPPSIRAGFKRPASLSELFARLFTRRRPKPSIDKLPEYLLRDAGLERIGGVTRRRLR